jgi:hypothetical protein
MSDIAGRNRAGDALPVTPAVDDVDLIDGKVLVSFHDGTAILFDVQFLYDHRNDEANQVLPLEPKAD